MPTTRAPARLASCPATEPTAPDAADTTTVSPFFGWQISVTPRYAVAPGMPSTPRYADSGAPCRGSFTNCVARRDQCVCQPRAPTTDIARHEVGMRGGDHLAHGLAGHHVAGLIGCA